MNKNEMIEWLHDLSSACEDMVMVKANFEDYNKPYEMAASDLIHEVIMVLKDDQRGGRCGMTREDAIQYLTDTGISSEHIMELVEALEQEPCEDEYIKVPKKALKYRTAGMVAYNVEWLKEHFDIERAVICGTQDPCTDAISRQAVIDIVNNPLNIRLDEIIKKLPPVKPAEKVGQWEYVQYDGNPNIGNWHCSECRAIINYTPTYNWEKKPYHKFCPNCGAKMQEVME